MLPKGPFCGGWPLLRRLNEVEIDKMLIYTEIIGSLDLDIVFQ